MLAAPPRWRRATVVVAVLFALWMSAAVVSLRWHYPSDALAGLAYGLAVMLLADGSTWRVAVLMRRRRRRRPGAPERRPDRPPREAGG